MANVTLPRNVHFIYEHALAQMELRLGWDLQPSYDPLDPWDMEAELNGQASDILDRAAYVGQINGTESVYAQLIRPSYQGGKFNRTRSENQYLTHWIYPYKGKFHPQMIRAILNAIGAQPGWRVLDNFSGSGTTLLESQLLGIDSVGVDTSPLCVLLGKVKTQAWRALDEIEGAVQGLLDRSDLHPDTVDAEAWQNEQVSNFIEIARMVTLSDASRRKRDASAYFPKNLKKMLGSLKDFQAAVERFGIKLGDVSVHRGDARDLGACGIEPGSVDAIVTSPPYSVALDYVKNDEHALTDMGYELDALRDSFIGLRGKGTQKRLSFYQRDMRKALSEMAKALKPSGRAVVVIGNVTKNDEEVMTTEDLVDWAEEAGLRMDHQMQKIVWGLYNVVRDEKIIFFTLEDGE